MNHFKLLLSIFLPSDYTSLGRTPELPSYANIFLFVCIPLLCEGSDYCNKIWKQKFTKELNYCFIKWTYWKNLVSLFRGFICLFVYCLFGFSTKTLRWNNWNNFSSKTLSETKLFDLKSYFIPFSKNSCKSGKKIRIFTWWKLLLWTTHRKYFWSKQALLNIILQVNNPRS